MMWVILCYILSVIIVSFIIIKIKWKWNKPCTISDLLWYLYFIILGPASLIAFIICELIEKDFIKKSL